MKKTKIIATIGPSSEDKEIIRKMYYSGMNVARLNLSHADHDFCKKIINKIKEINKEEDANIGIMLDLQGPVIRVGEFVNGFAKFTKGDKIRIHMNEVLGDYTKFSVSYSNLINDVDRGSMLKLNDGKLSMKVVDKLRDSLVCEVLEDGVVTNHKNLNAPGAHFSREYLTDKDRADIKFAHENDCDFLALSFVSSHEDILEVNDLLIELKDDHISIVSKIENDNALEDIEDIIKTSDAIMVARGDLGTEIPMERIPGIQKSIINKCHIYGKTSIVATEMLSSMETVIHPTRAEVSDVANAVLDGTDAIMLSGETTVGLYPVETVDMMSRIAISAEKDINYFETLEKTMHYENQDMTSTISYATSLSALRLKAKCIVTPTRSGHTAQKMSRFRPIVPIVAISKDAKVLRMLSLSFGIYTVKTTSLKNFVDIIDNAKCAAKSKFNLAKGDLILITGGYPPTAKRETNFLKIEEI